MIYYVNNETKEHRKAPSGISSPGNTWSTVIADDAGWIHRIVRDNPLPKHVMCEWRGDDGVVRGPVRAGNVSCPGDVKVIAYRPILDADTKPEPPRCEYCDGTGDVHSPDGEWRGECTACEPDPPAWDGESWPPPVGCFVESCASGIICEVLAVRKGKVIACIVETGIPVWIAESTTRPVRSEEERAVGAMLSVVECSEGHYTLCGPMADAMRKLYRAGLRFADQEDNP